jgi:hypothetical protein
MLRCNSTLRLRQLLQRGLSSLICWLLRCDQRFFMTRRRAYGSESTVGSSMLVVDAINERAAAFYEGNGFVHLPDSMRLVMPMHAVQKLLEP